MAKKDSQIGNIRSAAQMLTNSQRLAGYLPEASLSRALLEVWTSSEPEKVRAALLNAVEEFSKAKEPVDDQGTSGKA